MIEDELPPKNGNDDGNGDDGDDDDDEIEIEIETNPCIAKAETIPTRRRVVLVVMILR